MEIVKFRKMDDILVDRKKYTLEVLSTIKKHKIISHKLVIDFVFIGTLYSIIL